MSIGASELLVLLLIGGIGALAVYGLVALLRGRR